MSEYLFLKIEYSYLSHSDVIFGTPVFLLVLSGRLFIQVESAFGVSFVITQRHLILVASKGTLGSYALPENVTLCAYGDEGM